MKMKTMFIVSTMLFALFMLGFSTAEAGEKSPPPAYTGDMMLEHVGMDCTICHGEQGPKNVKMGNHPGQKCTDCHELKTKKIKKFDMPKKTAIAKSMMLEHDGMDCRICHGKTGPKGMMDKIEKMIKHKSMECTVCHIVEEK